jgi:hypothetical protein
MLSYAVVHSKSVVGSKLELSQGLLQILTFHFMTIGIRLGIPVLLLTFRRAIPKDTATRAVLDFLSGRVQSRKTDYTRTLIDLIVYIVELQNFRRLAFMKERLGLLHAFERQSGVR